MASTTAQIRWNALPGYAATNVTACHGFTAANTPGACTIWTRPNNPRTTNHTPITGPNTRPIPPDPCRWNQNRNTSTVQAIGTTNTSKSGWRARSPSAALTTEIAGVITPSPNSNAAPARTSNNNHRLFTARGPDAVRASREKIPPSPWLSARVTTNRYLTLTTRVTAQNNNDKLPSTRVSSGASGTLARHSRIAYSGLVPMSP